MPNKNQNQQGDVLLKKVNAQLKNYTVLPRNNNGKLVIMEGEATGHAHVIEDDDAELIKMGEQILLKLTKSVEIKHDEHHSFTLNPGIHQVGRVVEKDWINDMVNPVRD